MVYVSIFFEWKSRDLPTETQLTDLSFVTPANFPRGAGGGGGGG